jgi:phosphinothricin acetyltransferase
MIRPVELSDASQLVELYNYYVKTSTVTFEEELVTVQDFEARIKEIKAKYPYLVYEENGLILGYAYAGIFRTRVAYRFASESSVYVHHEHFKKGIGRKLYAALLPEMKKAGLKSAIGGITLPNEASVQLHEQFGFVKVAHFKEVGRKFDRWLDVGFWQLEL